MARLVRLPVSFGVGLTLLAGAAAASANKLAAAVSHADTHTCAVASGGGVWCWGDNIDGQLGDGTTADSSVPVAVAALSSGATAVSTDAFNSCALTTAGAVLCWGANWAGQLGSPTYPGSSVPVPVTGLSSGVAAISTSFGYSCALTTGGAILCWGSNGWGQFGNGTTVGSLVPVPAAGLTSGVSVISTNGYHACAVTTGGAALCWGSSSSGALGDGTFSNSLVPVAVSGLSSGVAGISAGLAHTCAVTTVGSVQCWGNNHYGQLGDGSHTDSNVPVPVSGLSSGVVAVSSGANHTCARTAGSGVLCWGDNEWGQLGNGSTTESSVPVAVSGLSSGVAAIAAGSQITCAVITNGSLECWGRNDYRALGIGWLVPQRGFPTAVFGFGPEAVPALGAAGLVLLSATLVATALARHAGSKRREAER
jgi:alpha-tubulin suppressor-like RCC1 family protein